jgi:hypothetical protein
MLAAWLPLAVFIDGHVSSPHVRVIVPDRNLSG